MPRMRCDACGAAIPTLAVVVTPTEVLCRACFAARACTVCGAPLPYAPRTGEPRLCATCRAVGREQARGED